MVIPKYRYAQIETSDIKTEAGKKRVSISFSSETPCLAVGDGSDFDEGKLFYEVLDHSDERNADLTALKNRGAFLDEHKKQFPLGAFVDAHIDVPDRKGRGVVELDDDGLGKERGRQMENKVRPHTSLGYRTDRELSRSMHTDGKPIIRFAWTGFEVSSVAVPRDSNVGVHRSLDLAEENLNELTYNLKVKNLTPDEMMKLRTLLAADAGATATAGAGGGAAAAATIDVVEIQTKARSEAATEVKTRAREIAAFADEYISTYGAREAKDGKPMSEKIRSAANAALQADETLVQFKNRCLTEVEGAKPAKALSLRSSGMSEADEESYSMMKGIQSAADNKRRGAEGVPDEASLEGEFHKWVVAKQRDNGGFGYEQSGFVMPFDYQIRTADGGFKSRGGYKTRKQRDMQAEVFAQGGAFVPTQLVTPPIEILRNMEVLSQLPIRHMDGLQGNIVIPRQDAAATAYSVSEIGALTASGQILGQIALTPKRVGATQAYSKQFVFQSTPDAESFLRDDLFKVIALDRDRLGLNGQGSNSEPLGVMNTPGVNSIVFGTTPTWSKIVDMETAILAANVVGPLSYVSTPSARGSLKKVAVALTGATTIGGAQNAVWYNDTVNAYQALASNQIPNNQMILGMWSDFISASWNGFDVVVDYVTKAVNAEIVITINIWCDFALRHPQSFCVSADSAAQ